MPHPRWRIHQASPFPVAVLPAPPLSPPPAFSCVNHQPLFLLNSLQRAAPSHQVPDFDRAVPASMSPVGSSHSRNVGIPNDGPLHRHRCFLPAGKLTGICRHAIPPSQPPKRWFYTCCLRSDLGSFVSRRYGAFSSSSQF